MKSVIYFSLSHDSTCIIHLHREAHMCVHTIFSPTVSRDGFPIENLHLKDLGI